MKYRIVMWASAGFLVAGCWALYFLMASKANPVESVVYILTRLTCPVAIAGSYFPLSVYWVLVANAATYALVSLIVEALRRRLIHAK
jgi:hypothetical protein